ncbi:MAG: hypothetical protein LUD80_04940, partial [Clostridiales bacterium]|nr:hypothetical protein [Clostridiales bacterium]
MKLGTHALRAGKDIGRKRPLACFCLSFAAGVCLSVYALVGWQMLLLGALCLLCGLACCINRRFLIGACLLAATAGFWLFWCRFYQVTDLEKLGGSDGLRDGRGRGLFCSEPIRLVCGGHSDRRRRPGVDENPAL